jgi:hypothetical protein
MSDDTSFPKHREIEYAQLCETYRQGVRTLFDTFKFFILFQGGLGTLAGAIFARSEFQSLRLAGRTIPINIPLLIISLVGFSTAIAAPFIATRLYRYHDTLVARARVIESQYDMAQISQLGDVWSEAGNYRSATTIALMTFAAIALPWLLGIIVSVYPS